MRVAVTYPGCHRRGGVERVMLECVNFLAERGHSTFAVARDWDERSLSSKVHQRDLRYRAAVPAIALPAFRRAATHEVDRIQPPLDVVAGFGAGAPPGAVVWMQSVHAAWIEKARASRGLAGRLRQRANPFHPVALAMERRQLRGREYSRLIALSPEVKSDITRIYDVPSQDIEVLPNGYSGVEFHLPDPETRSDLRSRLGFNDDHRVVVFVANELERKGFGPLVEAIARVGDPEVRLLAVGAFRQTEANALVARAKLEGRVVFAGGTSEVAAYYAAADVFALPTKYEAWGLVIIEAMACGLPVLTTRLAGASVAIRNGKTGVLLDDPGDINGIASGLRILLDGLPASAAEISTSVGQYEWRQLLMGYEEILQKQGQS